MSVSALEGAAADRGIGPGVAQAEAQSRWADWFPWRKKVPDEAKGPPEATEGVIGRMQAFFRDGVEHVARLAAMFVVQTVVLPLLFFWLVVAGLRSLLPPRGSLAASGR